MAARFLATYVTAPGPQHSVSMRFGSGDLRADMQVWASGRRPSRMLPIELDSYKWCKDEDTWVEAAHSDVSRDERGVTRASQAWLSSTLRLREDLGLWEGLDAPGRFRFEQMWRRRKAIAQLVPRRAIALTSRAMRPKAVLQLVYRTAGHAIENWSGHLKDALQPATRLEVMPQLTLCSRLQVEYLERVIKPGQVFTVPIVTNVYALALLGHNCAG